jgi:hypothetical protein
MPDHPYLQWPVFRRSVVAAFERSLTARDGSHHAATASVTLPNGRTVRICTVTNDACP